MKEALRYLENARAILRTASIEDNTYTDGKPVQEAFGTAYLAVLKAIDEYLVKKGIDEIGCNMHVYKERTKRKPSSMDLIKCPGRRPHFSVRNVRSTVITCETFATESLGRPESDAGTNTLPGASARRTFDVRTTAMIVRIRLRLKAFDWTITTGRLKPGSEAVGSGNSAHQISPRSITTPRGPTT